MTTPDRTETVTAAKPQTRRPFTGLTYLETPPRLETSVFAGLTYLD